MCILYSVHHVLYMSLVVCLILNTISTSGMTARRNRRHTELQNLIRQIQLPITICNNSVMILLSYCLVEAFISSILFNYLSIKFFSSPSQRLGQFTFEEGAFHVFALLIPPVTMVEIWFMLWIIIGTTSKLEYK